MTKIFGTITDLMATFRECLAAISPLLPPVGIEWEDAKQYDDWDAIAEALYASIVANSIAHVLEGQRFDKLVPYGLSLPTYGGKSYLYCRELGPSAAFLKLQTSSGPFDLAAFAIVDATSTTTGSRRTLPFSDLHFVGRVRSPDEERDIETVILREAD